MPKAKAKDKNQALAEKIAEFRYDPYGFVMFVFPWGEPGTFLEHHSGPDEWQKEALIEIGMRLSNAQDTGEPVRILRRSGHEIGKTAFIAWVILWWNSTREHPQGVVTANTRMQLEGKTWRELAKWHGIMIHKDWFEWTATKFSLKAHPATWFSQAVPWVKEKSEAFAGTHEKRGVLMIFDEASLIDDKIWEVADGAMDAGALWIAFGNPTRNTGKFYEAAVGKWRHRWYSQRIDSRKSKIANQARIAQWVEDFGEDSDYVRIRVKGEFPRASAMQFIPSDIVMAAAGRHLRPDMYDFAPKILGVDVARFGDDMSTIIKRQGLAAFDLMKFRGIDLMRLTGIVIQQIQEWKPDAIMVDATGGYGAAVVDRLRQLGYEVIEVQFGGTAIKEKIYHNKRTEIWGEMREWLKGGGAIPDDDELKADLVAPEYAFDNRDRQALESKDDMKTRGLSSPDCGDALACTFAEPVVLHTDRTNIFTGVRPAVGATPGVSGYDPTAFIRDARQHMSNRMRRG